MDFSESWVRIMRKSFFVKSTITAMAFTFGFPAFADITAQEVRDQMFSYYDSIGLQFDVGSEEMSGDTLSMHDLSFKYDVADSDRQIVFDLGSMAFRENGDGTVAIELPERLGITVTLIDKGKTRAVVKSGIKFGSFEGVVSGAVDDMRIQSSATDGVYTVDSVTAKGERVPANVTYSFGSVEADYTNKLLEDGRRRLAGEYLAKGLDAVTELKQPGGDGLFSMTASLASLASNFSVLAKASADPNEVLAAGIDVSFQTEFGSSDIDLTSRSRHDRFAIKASVDSGNLSMAVSPRELAYGFAENGLNLDITSTQLPFPSVQLGLENTEFSLRVPMAKSVDGPSDFHALLAFRGVSVGDLIWAMLDPGQTIPRDPATVAIDVRGKANVLEDLMDPITLAALKHYDGSPIVPVSLNINELTAIFGGAALTGEGSFAFNPDNPAIVNGVPFPVGEVNLSLDGGTGLLDKLAGIGLVPPEAALGIRAMLGAFAKPMGEDLFESKIEVTKDGGVLANGQQIQ